MSNDNVSSFSFRIQGTRAEADAISAKFQAALDALDLKPGEGVQVSISGTGTPGELADDLIALAKGA